MPARLPAKLPAAMCELGYCEFRIHARRADIALCQHHVTMYDETGGTLPRWRYAPKRWAEWKYDRSGWPQGMTQEERESYDSWTKEEKAAWEPPK